MVDDFNQLIGSPKNNSSFINKQSSAIAAQRATAEWEFAINSPDNKKQIFLLKQPENSQIPFTIYRSDLDGDPEWQLSPNPTSWRLIPRLPIVNPARSPQNWDLDDFVWEIGLFPPKWGAIQVDKKHELRVTGHYSNLAIGLMEANTIDPFVRRKLASLVYGTELVAIKPFVDFSIARKEFARQLYLRSPLAQRARSPLHLWFFMEYSACLHRLMPEGPGKTKSSTRAGISQEIQEWRQLIKAAKKGDLVDLRTIEKIQAEGQDWRCFINELLVEEAIRLIAEAEAGTERDLVHFTRQFLNAWAHRNVITSRNPEYQVYKTLSPSSAPKKRIGRPPGSKNKKG